MWKIIIFMFFFLNLAKAVSENYKMRWRKDEAENDDGRNEDTGPSSTIRNQKGDVAVGKFVDTMLSSEKYLKMIDTVDHKLNHVDAMFHEKTTRIQKYLAEMLRLVKDPPVKLQNALFALKVELDKLKETIARLENPKMRVVDGIDHQTAATLEARLETLETNVKSIQTGVDSIVYTIAEVKNRQYTTSQAHVRTGQARIEIDSPVEAMYLINEFRRTLQEQKGKKCDCKTGHVDRSERYPTDCHEIQMQGFNVSGIYKIKPEDMEPFYVLCELSTTGGGWTVFQNRFDGSQDFYKSWSDYKHGFGNLAGEFWLGLEKISCLTNQKLYELRIEMETQLGQEAYAGYSVFTVGPEHEGFRISTLGSYYGTAGDSLSYHAGLKFSTPDMDNDEWKDGACASEHGGAWWYKECDKSNLNGKYSATAEENRGQSIYWISFKGPSSPLAKTKMMIRPLPATKPIDYTDTNRNLLDVPKLRPPPDKLKNYRMKEMKGSYDSNQLPYRFEQPPRADPFFPSYA